jgi:hypothetical protein
MAVTPGRVVRINAVADIVCAFVGPSAANTELLFVQFRSDDSAFAIECKRILVKLLITAALGQREVQVFHGDDDALITAVGFLPMNISPVGPAIHNDFYSVTGSNIPQGVEVVFESVSLLIAVTPDLWRPHWVLIEQLPTSVPEGPCHVFLRAGAWRSEAVPVMVSSGAPLTTRTLYSGRLTTEPYTLVFAASPGIEAETGGTVAADPVLTDRASFHDTVGHCIENLLTVTESLLRTESLESSVRFVAIFDTSQTATAPNALVRRVAPNILEPMRTRLNAFVGRYWENPDIVFCISGSTTHTRASAWFTTDDATRIGPTFTYDGTTRIHRRYTDIPGSAALSTSMNTTGLTAIHEFGHAASDFGNGMVIDLYVDGTRSGFVVNKKVRGAATAAVPANFGTYDGSNYLSDQSRDGIGYPSTWTSYHPALQDATRPNLMDNYWLAADPQRCRLDRLTFAWFRDRLRAKILR